MGKNVVDYLLRQVEEKLFRSLNPAYDNSAVDGTYKQLNLVRSNVQHYFVPATCRSTCLPDRIDDCSQGSSRRSCF